MKNKKMRKKTKLEAVLLHTRRISKHISIFVMPWHKPAAKTMVVKTSRTFHLGAKIMLKHIF